MNKVILTLIAVLVLLALGIGVIFFLNSSPDKENKNPDYNGQLSNQVLDNKDNSVLTSTNPCEAGEAYSYLCFKYQMLEQEKRAGINNQPEQTRVEPCPAPRPICPLCYTGLEQEKGNGNIKTLEQDRTNC